MRITMADSMYDVPDDCGKAKKIANNTFEYRKPDGTRVIQLHTTDILEFQPDGSIVLNSGGWKTRTTKDRLNTYLRDYSVYTDRGLWRVHMRDRSKDSIPFVDGMALPDAFSSSGTKKAQAVEKAQRKLAKQISTFVAKLDKVDVLPEPDGGDCWACSMFDRADNGGDYCGFQFRTGSRSKNPDHLLEHVKEGYLHGSLLVNAMRWAGYRNDGIGIYYQRDDRRTIKSALRRYLRSQLGLPT